jgi:hypothetical protein
MHRRYNQKCVRTCATAMFGWFGGFKEGNLEIERQSGN